MFYSLLPWEGGNALIQIHLAIVLQVFSLSAPNQGQFLRQKRRELHGAGSEEPDPFKQSTTLWARNASAIKWTICHQISGSWICLHSCRPTSSRHSWDARLSNQRQGHRIISLHAHRMSSCSYCYISRLERTIATFSLCSSVSVVFHTKKVSDTDYLPDLDPGSRNLLRNSVVLSSLERLCSPVFPGRE